MNFLPTVATVFLVWWLFFKEDKQWWPEQPLMKLPPTEWSVDCERPLSGELYQAMQENQRALEGKQ